MDNSIQILTKRLFLGCMTRLPRPEAFQPISVWFHITYYQGISTYQVKSWNLTFSAFPLLCCVEKYENKLPEVIAAVIVRDRTTTDMQENMWARLRDSRPAACSIHATEPTYFPAFLYLLGRNYQLCCMETQGKIFCRTPSNFRVDREQSLIRLWLTSFCTKCEGYSNA